MNGIAAAPARAKKTAASAAAIFAQQSFNYGSVGWTAPRLSAPMCNHLEASKD
jgi:hypothetical protein